MNVLVADDDPVCREMFARALTDWGHTVIACDNGRAAWDVLQAVDAPRLAILDWMMPHMDGPEICRRVRQAERGRYTQIILVTVRGQKIDLVHGINAGADDYIVKPVDLEEFRARISAAVRSLQVHEDLLAAYSSLRLQVNTDSLTGVRTRRAIMELVEQELERAMRGGTSLGVAMVDLDSFKAVNDRRGHLAGDRVLRQAAHRMVSVLRSYDAIGRYGGDEFLVILPTVSEDELSAVCERLRRAVSAEPILLDDGEIRQTATIGAACAVALPRQALPRLIDAADRALLSAKSQGKDRVLLARIDEAPAKAIA